MTRKSRNSRQHMLSKQYHRKRESESSKRKRAEAGVLLAEQRYRQLIESVQAIVWECDAITWQFSFVSQGAEAILGYPVEQWIKEPNFWVNHIHPEDRERAVAFCQKSTADGKNHDFEYRAVTADGRIVWLRDIVRVVKNREGKPIYLHGVMVDITERKQAEEEIQRQLQRIRALREINLATSSTLDLHNILGLLLEKIDLLLPYATATTVRLFDEESGLLEPLACRNIDEQEWRAEPWRGGRGIQRLVFESKAPQTIRNVETDQRMRDLEFYRKHKLISYLGVPLIVKDKVLGVLSLYTKEEHKFSDAEVEFLSTLAGQAAIAIYNSQLHEKTKNQAAELEEANEDLKRKEEIQRILKEISQDITSLDLDSLVKKLTTKIREMLKADVSDVRLFEGSKWVLRGISGIDPSLVPSARTGTAMGRSGWIIKHRKPLLIPDTAQEQNFPSGETINTLGLRGYVAVPLFSRDGKVTGVLRALTYEPREFSQQEVDLLQQLANGAAVALENARLLEQIKSQAEELEKANRAKDEFLSFMSHEIRTPVNAVVGYAGMVRDGMLGEVSVEQGRVLGKILARSRDLLEMINGLLEVTRIEAGAVKVESREVGLNGFLNELRSSYDVPLGKELSLQWDYPPGLPVIRTDSGKLRHILQNLINNAIKYTDKGHVLVSARIGGGSRQQPEGNRRVEFQVSDTGIGIPKESVPFIFEMFQQGDGSRRGHRGGVGLGLYIVKEFTEMLGGKIEVDSEPGKGSTFTVTMPCEFPLDASAIRSS